MKNRKHKTHFGGRAGAFSQAGRKEGKEERRKKRRKKGRVFSVYPSEG